MKKLRHLAVAALIAASVVSVASASISVKIKSVTSPVRRGNNATLKATTAKSASCSITVTYKSGPSKAKGLETKSASSSGAVSWTWKVGTNTTPGKWPIEVRCTKSGQKATAKTKFEVTK